MHVCVCMYFCLQKKLPQTKQKQQNATWPCCLATYGDQEFKKQTLQRQGGGGGGGGDYT